MPTPTPPGLTRILIADDHPIVRDGLRLVLERRTDLTVVAEAATGRDAVRYALHLQPDVAIVDLDMPELGGVGVISELRRSLPACRCIVLSMHDDDTNLFDAMEAGAAGYLVKGASSDDIERAVRAAATGQLVFGPEVAARITRAVTTTKRHKGHDTFSHLSDRELQLLDLLATGLDNASIAQRLHLAPKTIRNQVSQLLTALGTQSRSEAIQLARQAGLGLP
jgi:DNA-binding NarL/FixJ family response regulator